MNRSRVVRSVVAAGAGVVLLAGCTGGVGPGEAVRVGDESVSRAQVDRAVEGLCLANADQYEAQGMQVAHSQTRQRVANTFAMRVVGQELAQEYGVEPGPEYNAARSQVTSELDSLEGVDEDLYDDVIDLVTTEAYLQAVATEVGRAALVDAGTARPDVEAAGQRGQEIFAEFAEAADVEFDPRFGLADGNAVSSWAVSFPALQGEVDPETGALDPSPDWVMTLPGSQRCG